MTTGRVTKVKELIDIILRVNKKKLKVVKKKIQGDSFGFDASNSYLKLKFKNFKFTPLEEGIKLYFSWINRVQKLKT